MAESGPAENTLTPAQSTNELNAAEHKHHLPPSSAQEAQVLQARHLIAHRIHEFIRNTRSSALGVTGSIALIFAAISMLSQIETTFNDIWGEVSRAGHAALRSPPRRTALTPIIPTPSRSKARYLCDLSCSSYFVSLSSQTMLMSSIRRSPAKPNETR